MDQIATGAAPHVVQFYDDDGALLDSLARFVRAGFAAGEAAVIVATAPHRRRLAERLREAGCDLEGALAAGRYTTVDAAETLERLMVDGMPDAGRFRETVGALLARAGRGGRLRVFGEMVGLLLTEGHVDATIRLEQLWNELQAERGLELLCACPIGRLGAPALQKPIEAICAEHSAVVPAESYPRDGSHEERLRAIVRLQQQAASLETEVAERSAAETALREMKSELELQLADLGRLHEMSARLTGILDVEQLLHEILQGALAVQGTSLGLLSLGDPKEGGLTLGAHAGFDEAFLKEVARVPPGGGACGSAFAERRRVVIEDVDRDPLFADHRVAARRAGFRACHSTPLSTRTGDIIGVLSVHFTEPHRPSERELRLMDLYARIAADSIENARLHRRLHRDLEERRQLLLREHAARAEAESANRMKDEFLATVSHELRTPLNAILGWSHILRNAKADEDVLARGADVIERNAHIQARLIEDILDASRVIAGSLRLERVPVDLTQVIGAAVESVQPSARSMAIELTVRLDPDAREVLGDASRLQQMVWNLLTNAIKFTHRGGRVELRLARVGGDAEIQVIDNGEGIPADFLPFVFDRFRQADSTITRRHGGLGLGLAIVRHLTTMHDGSVRADSPGEGYGSTFVIRLPLHEGAGALERSLPDPVGPAAPALRGVQVLVVDDDRDALDMLSVALSEAGALVRTAQSVAEAMALLRRTRPDVLVSDLAIPDEDGYALIRALRALERESGRETPAVALSAYVRVQDRTRAGAAGFNMFVEKPVDPQELISVIAGVTETRDTKFARAMRERPDTRSA
jgi:signal transduction histidine kinase/FixJ family two-component response regulator